MTGYCLHPDIAVEYPYVRELLFMSTVDPSETYDVGHVADAVDGYVTELERCGQASDRAGTEQVQVEPYSTRLLPVSPQDDVLSVESGVLLEKAEFLGYDSTLQGSPYQNADNVAAIIASQLTATDAYVASHFRGGIQGNWQPNWCRPSITVNGESILHFGDSHLVDPVTRTRGHRGHMSIGVALPYRVEFCRTFDRVREIRVNCGLAQWIGTSAEATDRLVRYPVLCMMRWRTR